MKTSFLVPTICHILSVQPKHFIPLSQILTKSAHDNSHQSDRLNKPRSLYLETNEITLSTHALGQG